LESEAQSLGRSGHCHYYSLAVLVWSDGLPPIKPCAADTCVCVHGGRPRAGALSRPFPPRAPDQPASSGSLVALCVQATPSSSYCWPAFGRARRTSGPAARAPTRGRHGRRTPGHDRGSRGRRAVHTCGAFCRALSPFFPLLSPMVSIHPSPVRASRHGSTQQATTRRVETTPRRCPSAPSTLRASKRSSLPAARRQPTLFSFSNPSQNHRAFTHPI